MQIPIPFQNIYIALFNIDKYFGLKGAQNT